MSNNTIAFIGGGSMAHAIARGLLESGFAAVDLLIAEPVAEQRKRLTSDLPRVRISASGGEVAAEASCIVLAVKPQILARVCRELAATVQRARPLIISIAAGVRSDDIDSWLGGGLAVVRVMPNQPALLGKGVSGLYANARVNDAQRSRAETIMAAVGRVVPVASEDDIDAVTAISGSGPAYFYLLMDMLTETAEQFGLDPATAATLVRETASGAAALATTSEESLQSLIERVRSPGGTTAAALDSLEQHHVRAIFARALTAARDRATQLADRAHAEE